MSFWKNLRYEDFESKAEGGDAVRGLPRRDFPWALHDRRFSDSENDVWNVDVLCMNISPLASGKRVDVRLVASAKCTLSDRKLESFGFEPIRIRGLTSDGFGVLSETYEWNTNIVVEDLEKISLNFLEKYSQYLSQKYSDIQKLAALKKKLAELPFGRFSDTDN